LSCEFIAVLLLQSQMDLITSVLRQTSPIAKLVLGLLLFASIGSWAVILSKALLLRKIRSESETFWRIFRKGHSLSEISTACESLRFTPLVPVLNAGMEILSPPPPRGAGAMPVRASGANSLTTLQRALQRASAAQLTVLENRLTFLATTAAVAPFIGLFGTVWGVLVTFSNLGNSNMATLRAVAPGIADALVTTAFGLFTAIPAVIFYNQFVHQIRRVGGQLDDLQVEMLAIGERNGL
jgi:biopolymer transport protein TolQ